MFDYLYKLLEDPSFKDNVKYNLRKFKANEKNFRAG